ncbi:Tetratricopeptide repeat protein 38 [Aphelenchoides fujianensis]|nr:Tetratricopeptide repeat protein 38 [Aphelenchoides fujianensis]
MTAWCAENLRDCQAWKDAGLPLSTTSNEAARLFDGTLRQLVAWADCPQLGGLEASGAKLLAADPDCIIGRCLVLGMDALGSSRSVHNDADFAASLDLLVADAEARGNERERLHARAVRQFARGEMAAASALWERVLADWPTDLLAVKFAHDAYFFRGDLTGNLHTMGSVLTRWTADQPAYSFVHGMHAFALEENEKYETAEREARFALEMNPADAWATHALAHCFEMTGRWKEGIAFMARTRADWEPAWLIACHNHWHNALFHLESGEYEVVLDLYDKEIVERTKSKAMLDLVDAASLLQRLEIESVPVGRERWSALVPLAAAHAESHVLAFNDAHLAMVFANAEDFDREFAHARSLQQFVSGAAAENENRRLTEKLGIPICESVVDFRRGEFTDAFDRLYAARHSIREIGGSNAQRDVFTQLALAAGLQSEASGHREMALEMLAERQRAKHGSLVGHRILERHTSERKE